MDVERIKLAMSHRENADDESDQKTDLMDSVAKGRGRTNLHECRVKEPRRSFVQKLSLVAGGIFASIPGISRRVTASEDPRLRRVRAEYDDTEKVRTALETHATELIEKLANRDLLESDSISRLLNSEVIVSAVTVDGTPTAHIEMVKELSTNEQLSVFVQPEVGRSYAIQKSSDGDTSATIYEFSTEDDSLVSPECTLGYACYNVSCGDFPDYESYKETYCCSGGDCYTGSETDCCQQGKYDSCSEVC